VTVEVDGRANDWVIARQEIRIRASGMIIVLENMIWWWLSCGFCGGLEYWDSMLFHEI